MTYVAIDGDLLQPLILLVLIFLSWVLNTLAEAKRKRDVQRRPPPRELPEADPFPTPTGTQGERRYRAPRPVPPPPPPQPATPHYRRVRKSVFEERPSSIPGLAPETPPKRPGDTTAPTSGIQFGLEVAGEMTGGGTGHRGSRARARQRLGLDGSPASGRQALRRAVLIAEVLGPPRIRKPHRGPLRDGTRTT